MFVYSFIIGYVILFDMIFFLYDFMFLIVKVLSFLLNLLGRVVCILGG